MSLYNSTSKNAKTVQGRAAVAMPNYNIERYVVTRTSLSLTNAGRRCHIIPDQTLWLPWTSHW